MFTLSYQIQMTNLASTRIGILGMAKKPFRKGIGIRANDNSGRSTLCYTSLIAAKGSYEWTELIFSKIKVVQFWKETRAYTSAKNVETPISHYKKMSPKAKKSFTVYFFEAVREGNLDKVVECIDTGIPKEAKKHDRWTALHFASFYGHLEIVKYLIETCQVNKDTKDRFGTTAFHLACKFGRMEVAAYLFGSCQVNPDAADREGCTALHIATSVGRLEVIKYLVETCRADKEAKDKKGCTALHIVTSVGRFDMVKYLIESKRIDEAAETEEYADAALHVAGIALQIEIVKYLVETCNVDTEAKEIHDRTALHCATTSNHLYMVKYLVMTGHADTEAKDHLGRTAYDLAVAFEYKEIAKYLKKAVAKKNTIKKQQHNNGDD